jgi:hypothetical protein
MQAVHASSQLYEQKNFGSLERELTNSSTWEQHKLTSS